MGRATSGSDGTILDRRDMERWCAELGPWLNGLRGCLRGQGSSEGAPAMGVCALQALPAGMGFLRFR